MKKLLILLPLLLLSPCAKSQVQAVNVENLMGETVSTASVVDGTPFILSFWSTTCKPCIIELNAMADLLEEWQAETPVKVVAVSIDDTRSLSKAKAFASSNQWPFTLLFDKNQDLKRAMNVSNIPQVFVLDGSGKVVYSHSGYIPGDENILFEKIKAIKE